MIHTPFRRTFLFAAISIPLCIGPIYAQRTEDLDLEPQADTGFNSFGFSTAIDGEWAVIGDTGGGATQTGAPGVCVIYRRTDEGWQQWQIISLTGDYWVPQFGHSVALHGTEIVVGSRRAGTNSTGAAYVFHLIGEEWVEVQQLWPHDGGTNYGYGHSLAFD
jgi:hypothetical protein